MGSQKINHIRVVLLLAHKQGAQGALVADHAAHGVVFDFLIVQFLAVAELILDVIGKLLPFNPLVHVFLNHHLNGAGAHCSLCVRAGRVFFSCATVDE